MDSHFLWSHPQMQNKSPTMSKTHANNSILVRAIKIPTHLKRGGHLHHAQQCAGDNPHHHPVLSMKLKTIPPELPSQECQPALSPCTAVSR